MPIHYHCLGCREELVLPDHKAGQLCACPRCRLKFVAPAGGRGAAPRPGPAPAPGGWSAAQRAPPTGGGAPRGAPPARPAAARPAEVEPGDAGDGLFGMGAGASRGLFGQDDVELGELFGVASDDTTGEDEGADDEGGAGVPPPAPHGQGPPGFTAPAPGPAQAPPGAAQRFPGYPPGYAYPPPGFQGYPAGPGYPPPGHHPGMPAPYPGGPAAAYPGGYPPGYPPGYYPFPGQAPPGGGFPGQVPPAYPGQPGFAPAPGYPAYGAPPPVGAPGAGASAPAAPRPQEPPRARGGRLICLDGLPDGTEFNLPAGKVYEIGRDKEADVKILSTSVSRRQAKIDVTGAGAVLIDCGSANGTTVNGEVVVDRRPLREGDLIKMGAVLFRFQSA